MTAGLAFLLGIVAGILGGLAVGFALGRRLPPKPARKVATMRHKIAGFMQHHVTSVVTVLVGMVLIGYFALGYAIIQVRDASDAAKGAADRATAANNHLTVYTHCVAGYLSDLGTAQTPRSQASVAVTDANHQVFLDTKLYGGDSPQVFADVNDYLEKYDTYQQAVRDNPLPPLPGCLTIRLGAPR